MPEPMVEISPTDFVVSGAEALLRVNAVRLSPVSAELSMASGPWLQDPMTGNRGALGVPLDDVTGYVVAAGRPDGWWPVSLGIRVDFLADPPTDGPPMVVTGELVARHPGGAATRGSVSTADGEVIALVTQRSHLIPVDAAPTGPDVPHTPPPSDVTVRDALGFRQNAAGVVEMAPTMFAPNGKGDVHGGVLIIGSERAALAAVGGGDEFRATSIDIAYVRPGDARNIVIFRSDVQHRGRSLAVVRVTAENFSGKPCALATVIVQRRQL
ncbi:PaaI family thioesterase [Gordonia sp. NPDC003424]